MEPTNANSTRRGWLAPHTQASVAVAGLGICLALLLAPLPLGAQEFQLNAEPAAALWLDDPQGTRFTPGFYLAVRPGIALGRVASVQWSYALLATPPGDGYTDLGIVHFLTAGLRLRPFGMIQREEKQLAGLFVDANLGYARTGELDRFGFDAGLGYAFQPNDWFSIGPVVRYVQIFQPDDLPGFDPNDAQLLTFGLNFGFGSPHEKEEAEEVQEEKPEKECPEAPECPVVVASSPCADGDRDGVCDFEDRCPTAPGPAATLGCPIDPCTGAPLMVLVQFPYDSAALPAPRDDEPQTMDPVLDAVAKAIAQNPSCRVCIIGNASEEGAADHNLDLSRQRASAVQGYLTARGLSAKRMPTTGLGASCQLVPEASRPLNRRVEFRRLDEGESCPTDCSK